MATDPSRARVMSRCQTWVLEDIRVFLSGCFFFFFFFFFFQMAAISFCTGTLRPDSRRRPMSSRSISLECWTTLRGDRSDLNRTPQHHGWVFVRKRFLRQAATDLLLRFTRVEVDLVEAVRPLDAFVFNPARCRLCWRTATMSITLGWTRGAVGLAAGARF